MRSHDLEAEWLRPSGCRELEPGLGTGVAGGISAPHEAALDPRRLVEALRVAAQGAGAELSVGAEASEVVLERGAARGVRTVDGTAHRAGTVVLAAGAWSGSDLLPHGFRPAVRPVKGQILTLRGPADKPVCERIVVSERVYIVPRGDGRLVVGATVEELGFDTRITAGGVHELLREAYRALPEIAELELAEAIAGLRPGTPDNAPFVGTSGIEGLVLATGHYRNGILLTPVTAEAVGAILDGQPVAPELAAADPARFALQVVR
jgi:glycine oxidase